MEGKKQINLSSLKYLPGEVSAIQLGIRIKRLIKGYDDQLRNYVEMSLNF